MDRRAEDAEGLRPSVSTSACGAFGRMSLAATPMAMPRMSAVAVTPLRGGRSMGQNAYGDWRAERV